MNEIEYVTTACKAHHIVEAANVAYWLHSHGIDVAFHRRSIIEAYDALGPLVAAMRDAKSEAA